MGEEKYLEEIEIIQTDYWDKIFKEKLSEKVKNFENYPKSVRSCSDFYFFIRHIFDKTNRVVRTPFISEKAWKINFYNAVFLSSFELGFSGFNYSWASYTSEEEDIDFNRGFNVFMTRAHKIPTNWKDIMFRRVRSSDFYPVMSRIHGNDFLLDKKVSRPNIRGYGQA